MRSRENNLFIFCCFFFTSGVNLHGAWNYGDVKRALRGCGNRGDRCIFEPEVGKVFESTEEAFEFYNMYSWEIGFGIRHGRCRQNKSGRRTMQDIVCACEVSSNKFSNPNRLYMAVCFYVVVNPAGRWRSIWWQYC